MEYTKTVWVPKETMVTAKNMNKIEDTLESLHGQSRDLSSRINETALDVAEIDGKVTQMKTDISQTAEEIKLKASKEEFQSLNGGIAELGERLTTAESKLSVTAEAITSTVSKSEFEKLTGRVDSLSHLEDFAGSLEEIEGAVNESVTTVTEMQTTVEQLANKIESKADKKEVVQIKTDLGKTEEKVTTMNSTITQMADSISSKVSKSELEVVSQKVDKIAHLEDLAESLEDVENKVEQTVTITKKMETQVNQFADKIESKADKSEIVRIEGELGTTNETVSSMNSTITQMADSISSKVSKSEFDQVSEKVDKIAHLEDLADSLEEIEGKVEQTTTTVSEMGTKVNQFADKIESKAEKSEVVTIKNGLGEAAEKITQAESSIEQLTEQVSQKVSQTTFEKEMSGKESSITKSKTAPKDAVLGQLWLDTSVTPNVLKLYNGAGWVKASPTTAAEIGAFTNAEGKALSERLTLAESSITQTANSIALKVDKTEISGIQNKVDQATNAIEQMEGEFEDIQKQVGEMGNGFDDMQQQVEQAVTKVTQMSSSIEQLSDSITSKVSKTELESATNKLDTDLSNAKKRIASAESSITQQAGLITSKVSKTDFTGEKVASLISQSPSSVKIKAKNIELAGAVSVLSDITGQLGTITAGTISSNTNINVANDIVVGNAVKLGRGISSGSISKSIRINGTDTWLYSSGDGLVISTSGYLQFQTGGMRTSDEASGYCGCGGNLTTAVNGVCFGTGVDFKVERLYSPSSVSLSPLSTTLSGSIKTTNVTSRGFWMYFDNQAAGLRYWRGNYRSVGGYGLIKYDKTNDVVDFRCTCGEIIHADASQYKCCFNEEIDGYENFGFQCETCESTHFLNMEIPEDEFTEYLLELAEFRFSEINSRKYLRDFIWSKREDLQEVDREAYNSARAIQFASIPEVSRSHPNGGARYAFDEDVLTPHQKIRLTEIGYKFEKPFM